LLDLGGGVYRTRGNGPSQQAKRRAEAVVLSLCFVYSIIVASLTVFSTKRIAPHCPQFYVGGLPGLRNSIVACGWQV
jgi:hypothetical protein